MAAKAGGGDPAANLTLRYAIDEGKEANMPKDTILNAIRKGTGELAAENYEAVVYEGYGPCGVAFLVHALTDNRQRTGPELRKIFDRAGGQLGATNCVAYMFTQTGSISIPADKTSEDALMEIALEAGADDVTREGDFFEITCAPEVFGKVKDALAAKGIEPSSSELAMVASTLVTPSVEKARQVLNLMENLEDQDDVQKVFANLDIPDELMKELENEG